jgi:multiple antibiotic resistance protein
MELDLVKAFVSMLVIINPLGAIPIYISLTARHSLEDRTRIIKTASIAVGIILITSVFVGEHLIRLFGISIGSFQVGGGILVLLLSLSMLQAQTTLHRQAQEAQQETGSKENIAVVPLALPLLAGPGAISTIIITANKASSWYESACLGIISMLIAVVIWGALKLAEPISKILGQTGIHIATRIMGLLLAAIAIEFMIDGLKALLPVLQH